jgi:hypothetical protein
VVLGVPHHAVTGEHHICERRRDAQGRIRRRVSDEGVAGYALVAFSVLAGEGVPVKLVIMAHATTHDPNKHLSSPYCEEVFAAPLGLLFECHGSGPHRPLALELSAGRNALADPVRFGRLLWQALRGRYDLGVQARPGVREALIFRRGDGMERGELTLSARKTDSLVGAERVSAEALHLEAKPLFRARGERIPRPGVTLGRAIARAVLAYGNEEG